LRLGDTGSSEPSRRADGARHRTSEQLWPAGVISQQPTAQPHPVLARPRSEERLERPCLQGFRSTPQPVRLWPRCPAAPRASRSDPTKQRPTAVVRSDRHRRRRCVPIDRSTPTARLRSARCLLHVPAQQRRSRLTQQPRAARADTCSSPSVARLAFLPPAIHA
jgi:hypothetical protein